MARFRARSGSIYFEHRGARANPRALLIHGLGCQLVQWPESLLEGFVANDLCAVTFDNRDAGLSQGADERPPSMEAIQAALAESGPSGAGVLQTAYTLSDMAQDAVDLLDHLGQAGAHVIGCSMGGAIAQRMAAEHPERVYSLTCIMSSSGDPALPRGDAEAERRLLATLAEESPEHAIVRNVDAWRALAGPYFDSEVEGIGRFARRAVERAHRPEGTARQLAALLADGDRGSILADVAVPTLVIHGKADPLVPIEAGIATAEAIPEADFLAIERMGHDLPEPLIDAIVGPVVAHIRAVEVSR